MKKKHFLLKTLVTLFIIIFYTGCISSFLSDNHIYRSDNNYNRKDTILISSPIALINLYRENDETYQDTTTNKLVQKNIKESLVNKLTIPNK